MLVKRSKESDTKQRKDKGSLILLWIMITLCFTFGFIFAKYNHWESINFVFAGIGLLIIIVGFIVRWMTIIQLKKAFTVDVAIGQEHELKTSGMYKWIRHPSYLGLLLIMVGFSLYMNSIISVLVIFIPMLLVIMYRISVEENVLIEEFGDSYVTYKLKTKKIIPWVI